MNQTKQLKDQIQQLINQRNQQLTNFLLRYQNDASILGLLAKFEETAEEVLWINLTWQAISRNNQQPLKVNDLKTQFQGNLLTAIQQELTLIKENHHEI